MIRSGFHRRNPARTVQYTGANPSAPRTLVRAILAGEWLGRPEPNLTYVRDPKLLLACRDLPCQHCGADDGTVVPAQMSQAKDGNDKSIKASGVYIAALCGECHHELDQGWRLSRLQASEILDAAHRKTVVEIIRRGLWPAGVEVPT